MSDSKKEKSPPKYTNEDLKRLQSYPLWRKIQITQSRILEFAKEFDNKIYVSFSGGKDSTVLFDIVRKMPLDTDVPAVFVDTGLEFPEVREFALSQDNVIRLKPEMSFRKVIETYGYPLISKDVSKVIYEARHKPDGYMAQRFDPNSEYNIKYNNRYSCERWDWLRKSDAPISHMCCEKLKKAPAKKYEKESRRKPILATMACESALRKSHWLKEGCNAFNSKRPTSQPMSFWTEQDVLEYIAKYNLPYASVYGEIKQDDKGKYFTTKMERTGCIFCGFGAHRDKSPNRFQLLKQTHPKLWEYCMKDWDDGGLGMRRVLEYINVKVE